MNSMDRAGSVSRLPIVFIALLSATFGVSMVGLTLKIFSAGIAQAGNSIIYVDQDASGAFTGLSWTDAFTDMQDALAVAGPGTEIWVAEGIYKPTQGGERSVSFALRGAVAVYGGFSGDEVTREGRDWQAHPTILSGYIGGPSISDDNSYHVTSATNVLSTTILDG